LKRIVFCFRKMFYVFLNAWKLLSILVVFSILSKNASILPELSVVLENANIKENLFSIQEIFLHFLECGELFLMPFVF
jgi:hypothetical protein